MVSHIRWHHVFDAEAEVGGTFDLRVAEQGLKLGTPQTRVSVTLTSMVLITGWPVS